MLSTSLMAETEVKHFGPTLATSDLSQKLCSKFPTLVDTMITKYNDSKIAQTRKKIPLASSNPLVKAFAQAGCKVAVLRMLPKTLDKSVWPLDICSGTIYDQMAQSKNAALQIIGQVLQEINSSPAKLACSQFLVDSNIVKSEDTQEFEEWAIEQMDI